MSRLLFSENPLVVNPELAKKIGLNEAIILQQLHYWSQKSSIEHDGYKWVYNTIEQWHEQFMFFSKDTIKRTLKKLKDAGLIKVERLSNNRLDRTNYYAIDYKKLESIDDARCIGAKCTDARGQNAPMSEGNLHQCINDKSFDRDYTETTTENKKNILKKSREKSPKSTAQECADAPKEKFKFNLKTKQPYSKLSDAYKRSLYGYAITKDAANQYKAFVDYHAAKGTAFKDWAAAYRTWLNNAVKYGGKVEAPIEAKGKSGETVYLDYTQSWVVVAGDASYTPKRVVTSEANEQEPNRVEPVATQRDTSKLIGALANDIRVAGGDTCAF